LASALLFCLHSPLYYGIYVDNILESSSKIAKKTSEALLDFYEIIKKRDVKKIYYARGPGNLTSLKLTHTFLHTLSITHNIALFATNGFSLYNEPILAFGNKCFVMKDNTITLQTLDSTNHIKPFECPKQLDTNFFCEALEPLYIVPPL